MNPKKHLSFGSLCNGFGKILLEIEDKRQKGKVDYSIHDTMLSGLACMVFQDPNLVEFQRRLESSQQTSNLTTLFGVKKVPREKQMREIIDMIAPEDYQKVFKDYFSRLQRGKHLKQYEDINGYYICSIDGTQYFSSNSINCEQCLSKEYRDGEKTYSHQALQAAIVHPDMRQVIPLIPEEIKNTDGKSKQDCEINAGKRLIPKIRKDHPQLNLIIAGDSLYSKQPFIETILEKEMHYILTAKPGDHKSLMEWINAYDEDEWGKLESIDDKERKHVYKWMNEVPLNDREDTLNVNYFEYRIEVEENNEIKINYKNSWVRAKWKIENECFNTLKNQGYHIEHNYGHGKKNLCYNFYLLTLLAFFMHQISELTDRLYQACRKKFVSKRSLWERLRVYIETIVYQSWECLLGFALDPDKYGLCFKT
jgi:hypothetical protein